MIRISTRWGWSYRHAAPPDSEALAAALPGSAATLRHHQGRDNQARLFAVYDVRTFLRILCSKGTNPLSGEFPPVILALKRWRAAPTRSEKSNNCKVRWARQHWRPRQPEQ